MPLTAQEHTIAARYVVDLKVRAFKIADAAFRIGEAWRILEEERARGISQVEARTQADLAMFPMIPIPFVPDILNPFTLIRANITALGNNARQEISVSMTEPFGALTDAVAVLGFLDGKLSTLIPKYVEPLEAEMEIERYDAVFEEREILSRLGYSGVMASGRVSEWMSRALAATAQYIDLYAPQAMKDVFFSNNQRLRGGIIVSRNIDVSQISSEIGASASEIQEALKVAGLGDFGLSAVIAIVVLSLLVAAAGVAIGAAIFGGKAADVAGIEIDRLTGLHEKQLRELVALAKKQNQDIADEPDPSKRQQMAQQAANVLTQAAQGMNQDFKNQADISKDAINEAGKGLDFSKLLLPVGILVGGAIALKIAKVI